MRLGRIALVLSFCLLPFVLKAQVSGISTLAVFDIPTSARAAGVGFDFLSIYDDDVSLTLGNPSLISDRHHRRLAVGFTNLFGGANFGSVAYAYNFKHLGALTFGLMYDSYGRFDGYDEADNPTGSFSAADYVFSLGWGHAVDEHVSIGASFKPVVSHYEQYTAVAFGVDLAATYMSLDRAFSATLMGRNIGAQVVTLSGTRERLPFELAVAGSYKLKDAPFRLLFAEVPGAIIQIRDEDYDYLDAEFMLQDVVFYPLGHPVHGRSEIKVDASGKNGILNILESIIRSQSSEGED